MPSKRTIPYGGKSGIFPKPRPVFKRLPIRPPTETELAEEAKHEQGYKGVPVPKRKGFIFHATPQRKPVMSVDERIKKFIDDRAPQNVDESKLNADELWQLKRNEIRRQHLRDAYLVEAERLHKFDTYREEAAKKQAAKAAAEAESITEETTVNLPTIHQYLASPMVRQRTPEETEMMRQQRELNRNVNKLAVREAKAESLLDLYHAAGSFITTEEELVAAIKEKFSKPNSSHTMATSAIKSELKRRGGVPRGSVEASNQLVTDAAMGTVNGQAGLNEIRSALNGEEEQLKRQAQLKYNESRGI